MCGDTETKSLVLFHTAYGICYVSDVNVWTGGGIADGMVIRPLIIQTFVYQKKSIHLTDVVSQKLN